MLGNIYCEKVREDSTERFGINSGKVWISFAAVVFTRNAGAGDGKDWYLRL